VIQGTPQPQVTLQGQAGSSAAMSQPQASSRWSSTPASSPSSSTPVAAPAAGTSQETTTTVQAPPAQVTVQVPRSRIVVVPQAPQIVVRQQEPEVVFAPAPAPQVTMQNNAEPAAALRAAPAAPVATESDSASALPREAALPEPFVKPDPKISGVVDRVVPEESTIHLTDGRKVLIGPKTVVFKDDPRFPIDWGQALPGMTVLIVDPNPVVSVDGRTIRVNDTIREEAGGTLIPDQAADYRGFPAAADHGGMQTQSGGR
jgi:hypothetical protein